MQEAAQAKAKAEQAWVVSGELRKAAKIVVEQLSTKRKRLEELETKIGGLRFKMDTRTAELKAKCSDL